MVIDDVELVKSILQNKNGHFIKPPRNPLVKILHMGVANSWAVLWPGDPGHPPGLRAKFFVIFYVNLDEFLI